MKNVFVSGCFDPLHSGHIAFFKKAASYGNLYVGIGSDKSIRSHKNHKTFCPEEERLFVVKSICYVKEAFILSGIGRLDFIKDLENSSVKFDFMIVNEDQHDIRKEAFCNKSGIKYIVHKRKTIPGLPVRSSTQIREYHGEPEIPRRYLLPVPSTYFIQDMWLSSKEQQVTVMFM